MRIPTRAVLVQYLLPRLALPALAGGLVAVFSDFGSSVSVELFSALAQILPVLALAGFVEALPAIRDQLGDQDVTRDPVDEEEIGNAFVRLWVYAFVGYLIVGEAASLWAVGEDRSSTFLLLTACVAGILMVQGITEAHIQRYKPLVERRVSRAVQLVDEAGHTAA